MKTWSLNLEDSKNTIETQSQWMNQLGVRAAFSGNQEKILH